MKNEFKRIWTLTLCAVLLVMASCSSDDNPNEPTTENVAATLLDCDLFLEDLILTDNPDAPVDYIINCHAAVKGKLTIEPGVVIHYGKDARLRFMEGSSFSAIGTADKPIVMTGTESSPGWWEGILFLNTNFGNIMEYVEISYGGGQTYNGHGHASVVVYSGSALTMKNSIISHSEETAFEARYNNTFINIKNNRFSQNVQPLIINYLNAHEVSATNDYTGNNLDKVLLIPESGAIVDPVKWEHINVPYRSMGDINIATDGKLTLEPGVVIEMTSGSRFKVIDGSLSIIGTQESPITIRGKESGPGSWRGIFINSENPNNIQFATISDTGEEPLENKGAVDLWYNASLSIIATTFKDAAACGVYGRLLPGQDENPNYSYSGLTMINTACGQLFEH
ncbi:hypothetical protein [Aequorivita viscosa]|uniref:Right handed beta helix region n=1 Tax=Aequorivita viscosa TaxID=797419 RepID=A0A1M6AUN0_9FLAO|nr:hypothetical protein [Aequorivita viscosa]SDW30148.1 hypothetical protein SAMN05216556_10430 [Aequorivita viscosa]SHI40137.1 hypothetical protein SAMN04487908_10229 [Aequorivita viscosa]